jgi:hypothetical protein
MTIQGHPILVTEGEVKNMPLKKKKVESILMYQLL